MQDIFVHKKVKSISFGMMSPKRVKQMASVKVITPELYDKEGYPVDGGLMDVRLGVIDPGLKCKTCGSKLKECTGHFGYIELARPIIHVKFATLILNLLRCTCRECSKPMIPKKKIEQFTEELAEAEKNEGIEGRRKKVKEIIRLVKPTGVAPKCPHCEAKQYKMTIEKPTTFLEGEKRISPIEIRTRLEKIDEDYLELFGMNFECSNPSWMVLTVLAIPPVTMRPSITLESGERSEDDLTHKLGDIVRINQRLFENINAGAPEIIIEDLWDLLQYHITTFFDNDIAQLPPARHRSGQPLKTLTGRIKSKEGRIRHNLAGKRTNFSARTVISPDPMLDLNEVGVPLIIAMKLSVPEYITEWNMAYLRKFLEKGPNKYPGANYICRPDGKKKKITSETKEALLEEIQPGYIIERHLMDGDIGLFNRQPSLHRMSMMSHRIKVLPGKTLRLNPAVCNPYNADFDGDEMNLHIPQTHESRVEAEYLMEVQTQLISPRYGLAVIGCNQDSISGNYLLTKQLIFPREEAINLLGSIGVTNIKKLGTAAKKTVTGKEVVSCLFPDDFEYTGRSRGCKKCDSCLKDKCNDDAYIKIKNGVLKTGILDKSTLGTGQGLMIRRLHKKYGKDFTATLLGQFFKIGILTLEKTGFSVAISDTDMPKEAQKEIHDVLEKSYLDVDALIAEFKAGNLEALPGKSIEETLELRILDLLSRARNAAGGIVKDNADENCHTVVMANSGARGNIINLAQMAAVIGQQALRGGRIKKGYKGRTLSCFENGDLRPTARGFIRNSFRTGMAPSEFFFAAMTGRDSLMDTALRTPKSGYLYRRLANAMQDLKVEYDETVRDSSKRIIQFNYGGDGIDVSKSEGGNINIKAIVKSVVSKD